MSNKLIATSTLATALLIGGLTNPHGNNLIAQASAYGTDLYEAVSERVHGAVLTQPGVLSLNTMGVENFDEHFAATQVFPKRPPGKRPPSTKGIQYQAPAQGEQSTRPYQYNNSRKSHRPEQKDRSYRSDEASRPNQSRKPVSGARFVSLDTTRYDSPQFVTTYAASVGQSIAEQTPRYIF